MNGSSSSAIDSRSMPEAIPPCGGAPIASASSRKPNFAPLLLGRDARAGRRPSPAARARGSGTSRRRARCRCRRGRRRSPAPRPGRCRAARSLSAVGRVNGWCTASQRSRVLVPLEHREVGDPEEPPRVCVDQLELAAEVQPQRAEHARRPSPARRRRRARVVAGLATGTRSSSASDEELRDRRAHLAVLAEHEVREPLRAPLLRDLLELRELAARELLRDAQEAHRRGVGEDAELGAARDLGRVLDLEPEAQVGLVGAVAQVAPRPRSCAGTASRARRRGTRARSAATIRSISANRNSWSGNAISTSSCVSSWSRSARRSSSRKQRAIW